MLICSAAEYELRELKLSVDDQLRSRDDHVRQLQTKVTITVCAGQSSRFYYY